MTPQYMLGIDIGTSLIKTVIFNLNGAEVGLGTQKVKVDSPQPNWFQQDMAAVWQGAAASIKEAIAAAGIDPAQIAVVGPTGQGDGAWMLDAAGRPVGPAPLWNDGRAGDIINVKTDQTYTPNMANHQKYTALYQLYHNLIEPMAFFWTARQKLLDEEIRD